MKKTKVMSNLVEVDEVWKNKQNQRYVVYEILENRVKLIGQFKWKNPFIFANEDMEDFIKDYSYVGKSKNSIRDLGKVEDEI